MENLPTPTSNSEPATKEYVDGNNIFNYKKRLLVSTIFTPTNSRKEFDFPNRSEVDEFSGFYCEAEFINCKQRDNGTGGILLGNSDTQYSISLISSYPFDNLNPNVNIKIKRPVFMFESKRFTGFENDIFKFNDNSGNRYVTLSTYYKMHILNNFSLSSGSIKFDLYLF